MTDKDTEFEVRYERMARLGDAYHGVKTCTEEESVLLFSDSDLAEEAEKAMGTNPLEQLGYTPYDTPVVIEMKPTWAGKEGTFFGKYFPANTNLYMLLAAVDEGLMVTENNHHVFFEGFEVVGERDGVKVLEPLLGS